MFLKRENNKVKLHNGIAFTKLLQQDWTKVMRILLPSSATFVHFCRVDFLLMYFLIILFGQYHNYLKDLFDTVMQANDPVDLFLLPGELLISYLIGVVLV